MTLADVNAHQSRHGFLKPSENAPESPVAAQKPLRGAKQPNGTERQYGLILEAQKRHGDIDEYRYEGLTLRWGDGMRYTPDYVVYGWAIDRPICIEVKGAHIYDRDLVRYKGCRAEWKQHFDFQMHQKKAGTWSRIL